MTLKNISLRWKFFFGFLITSLVPIVGFGVYAYTNTEKILLEQSYGNMEENLARATITWIWFWMVMKALPH